MIKKVFIIDNDVTGLRYTTQWTDFVPQEIRSWGYSVDIIKGHPNPNWRLGYHNNFMSLSALYNNIGQLHQNGHIPNDAIFIIPNARTPIGLALNELRSLASDGKRNWKIIAFWDEGIYYTYLNFKSNMYYGKYKGYYDWSLKFEKFLSSCYDINLVNNEYQLEHFNRHLGNNKANVQLCPNPFSSLYDFAKKQPEPEKNDIIVCITRPLSEHDSRLFFHLKDVYPQYDFIRCYEKNYDIMSHYRTLSRAKIVISHSAKEVNPFPIWEALLFGCIPLIPDSKINKLFFGYDYLFPRQLLAPPFINYVKGRHFILDKIEGYMENYADYTEMLPTLAETIHNKYYSSQPLKEILCNMS